MDIETYTKAYLIQTQISINEKEIELLKERPYSDAIVERINWLLAETEKLKSQFDDL